MGCKVSHKQHKRVNEMERNMFAGESFAIYNDLNVHIRLKLSKEDHGSG